MEKQVAKEAIRELEYYKNGFDRLSGCGVSVVNVRVGKKEAVADVILYDMDEDASQRYNGCRYPVEVLEKQVKKT